MICAYINGKPAYPVANNNIKITLQNPFIKDGDEKTMEIVFPLDIPENRAVFGALNRLDTSFLCEEFEDCRLIADNYEVVRGKGTITSITDKEVKIQILAGKSYLRYKASFDNVYIDQLDYVDVLDKYKLFTSAISIQDPSRLSVLTDLQQHGFVGQPGLYAFMPVHDEDGNIWANAPGYIYSYGRSGSLLSTTIVHAAVQPNLMMVFKKVMEHLGYTIIRNDFDVSPWNKLYVASARVSLSIAKALPHWSCYKFLDEMRKLFNAVFIFDETNKTVAVVHFENASGKGTEEIKPVDEFSTSYDEEGLEYLESSNLEYELSDCERTVDVISEDIQKMFEIREYESEFQMRNEFSNLSVKDKLTSLFHCPSGWFYGISIEVGNSRAYYMKECGWFSPLIRRKGAGSVTLNIVPVAMSKSEVRICLCVHAESIFLSLAGYYGNYPNMILSFEGPIAHVSCQNQTETGYLGTKTESEVEYVTVQDVLENGESGPENEKEDSILEVFFVDGQRYRYRGQLEFVERLEIGSDMPDPPSEIILPVPFTDSRLDIYESVQIPAYSMALIPSEEVSDIGQFHNKGLKIRRNVNGNNEICFKFPYDGKPDPGKIYICRGKRFICSRIEMAINANGIDPMKTGYFYEILS